MSHAFKILDWYENLLEKEIPPEWMWPFEEELESWFDEVKRSRNSGSSDDEDSGPMLENELAKGRR